MVETSLKIISFFVYSSRIVYWFSKARQMQKRRPIDPVKSIKAKISLVLTLFIDILILSQLSGINILTTGSFLMLQLIGFILVIIGTGICIQSRREISDNWTYGTEYQIKKNHKLVTTGLYKYVRHPIYLGAVITYIGAEMVSESYLFISFFAFLAVFYFQSKREERVLITYFGESYRVYMKKTKMLIPFIF